MEDKEERTEEEIEEKEENNEEKNQITEEKKDENNEEKKEENSVDKKEEASDSLLQNGVTFDGKGYNYTDPNGVKYTWDATKKSWEKVEPEGGKDGSGESKQNPQYGFDGTHHTYTDPKDNTVYIWDRDKNAWFPKIDDDFLANYQMNYGFVDNTTVEEDKESEKAKAEVALKRKGPPPEPNWFEVDEQHNTKVYVSNLPLDTTEEEFVNFMQKCGLVMKDVNTNKWKVKLYTQKDTNVLKGDALCTYIKRESVDLALNVLDGSEFKGNIIEVQRAKFEMKGEYNPALKPKKKRRKEKEREKKIQEKLFDWRPDKLRGEREKHERTVIIKNLFEPSTFDNHVELILEYTQDLREECSKCGTIRKLVLHDKHPEGVAQVTFSDPEEADICIKLLNNRWFGQRKITAETWDGKTKYKVVEGEAEVKKRLEKWNKFLESENPK